MLKTCISKYLYIYLYIFMQIFALLISFVDAPVNKTLKTSQ